MSKKKTKEELIEQEVFNEGLREAEKMNDTSQEEPEEVKNNPASTIIRIK